MGALVVAALQGADVAYRFYAPELGVGPVDVYPGQVAEARVIPEACLLTLEPASGS